MKNVFNRILKKKGYANQHKMCPHCGKFVTQSDVTCPYCHGPIGHIRVSRERSILKSDGQVETTWLLVGICVFFYILMAMKTVEGMGLGIRQIPDTSIFQAYWAPSGWVALLMGSNYHPLSWGGDVWRFIQYMFLHGGIMHIGFNLYALVALGPLVNQAFGVRRFWIVILVTGIMGGILSSFGFFFGLRNPSVGVSGALFGLIGVMYAFFKCEGNFANAERFKKIMINANLFCIVITLIMPIDNLAHLGGMFSGIGLGFLMYRYASSKLLIMAEHVTLILISGIWIWGLFSIFQNLSHMKELAGY